MTGVSCWLIALLSRIIKEWANDDDEREVDTDIEMQYTQRRCGQVKKIEVELAIATSIKAVATMLTVQSKWTEKTRKSEGVMAENLWMRTVTCAGNYNN